MKKGMFDEIGPWLFNEDFGAQRTVTPGENPLFQQLGNQSPFPQQGPAQSLRSANPIELGGSSAGDASGASMWGVAGPMAKA